MGLSRIIDVVRRHSRIACCMLCPLYSSVAAAVAGCCCCWHECSCVRKVLVETLVPAGTCLSH